MRISRNRCYVHVLVKCCQMEEKYGEKMPLKETFEEKLQIYQREANKQYTERIYAKEQVDRIKKSILHFQSPI